MIRKKGSLIIENMLSSAMIIILILGICQVILSKDKWHEIKNKEDEFTRITYAVEEELKYNLSIEEIKNFDRLLCQVRALLQQRAPARHHRRRGNTLLGAEDCAAQE